MAKKKTTSKRKPPVKKRSWDEHKLVGPDEFMSDWVKEIELKNQMPGTWTGDEGERIVIGIPLTSFSQRLIFQYTHLPLGRTLHCYGLTESLKSAFCFELMRWIVRVKGGRCIYGLNESRDQAVLRNSTIGYRFKNRVRVHQCRALEEWQTLNTRLIQHLEKSTGRVGGYGFPIAFFIDSLVGTASQSSIDDVFKTGHASINFSKEANLINYYTKVIFQHVAKWPFLWVATNHMKVSLDRNYHTVKRTSGGASVGFYTTFGLEMERLRDHPRKADGSGGRWLRITSSKNSLGDGRRKLLIDVHWWKDADRRQTTVWDWHAASIEYLDNLWDIEAKDSWRKRIFEIVDLEIDRKSKRVTSKDLGLSRADYWEAGQAIEENQVVREGLDKLFGISEARTFIPEVPYYQQVMWAIDNVPMDKLLPDGPYSILEPEDESAEQAARNSTPIEDEDDTATGDQEDDRP